LFEQSEPAKGGAMEYYSFVKQPIFPRKTLPMPSRAIPGIFVLLSSSCEDGEELPA
jgi:hypothetical protein